MTNFEAMCAQLEAPVTRMPPAKRALFLLAYAQRLAPLFEEYERKAPRRSERFDGILDQLWRVAARGAATAVDKSILEALETLIPGEDWVVDGFYDALAQNVGGLAAGALEIMLNPVEASVWRPEAAIFDTIRLLLAEMRLGCTDPGNTTEGRSFDDSLPGEPLVEEERRFWLGTVTWLESDAASTEDLRRHAVCNALKMADLQPALALGLAKDRAGAWQR